MLNAKWRRVALKMDVGTDEADASCETRKSPVYSAILSKKPSIVHYAIQHLAFSIQHLHIYFGKKIFL